MASVRGYFDCKVALEYMVILRCANCANTELTGVRKSSDVGLHKISLEWRMTSPEKVKSQQTMVIAGNSSF